MEYRIIISIILILCLVVPATATSIVKSSVSPDKDCYQAGKEIYANYILRIESQGYETFPGGHNLKGSTSLRDASWGDAIMVDGVEPEMTYYHGYYRTISGFVLSYPYSTSVYLNISVRGEAPPYQEGSSFTIMKLVETGDDTGYGENTAILEKEGVICGVDQTTNSTDGYHNTSIINLTPVTTIPTAVQTPHSGSAGLCITSNPSGAMVLVDNVFCGKTPCTLTGIEPGQHTLTIEHDDYDTWTLGVVAIEGQTLSFSATMQKSSSTEDAETTLPSINLTETQDTLENAQGVINTIIDAVTGMLNWISEFVQFVSSS